MILCIGVDRDSLHKRNRRLRQAGYETEAALLEDASRALQSCEYDMLIIGQRVSDEQARAVSARFRARSPEGRIVILHSGSRKGVDFADAVIAHVDDCENLIEAIQTLICNSDATAGAHSAE